jgi:hypothetical protein
VARGVIGAYIRRTMKRDNGLPDLPQDLQDAVNAFAADDAALLQPFLTDLVAQPPPSLIYHYTDPAGLRGILERFAARFEDHPKYVEQFALSMWNFATGGGIQASGSYFVASFSTLGDDLAQWCRYADDGCGYALAFDAGLLEQKFAEPFAGRTCDSLIYQANC